MNNRAVTSPVADSTHLAFQTPLSDQQMLQLASPELPSYRVARYQADDVGVQMNAFTPSDQQVLRDLYATMLELLKILQEASARPKEALCNIQDFMHHTRWSEFIVPIKHLGLATDTWQPTDQTRRIVHDLKGGCFVAASMTLQMMERGLVSEDDLLRLFFLTRDYLKIMRSGLIDIDPERRAQDSLRKAHNAQLLVDKWQESAYRTSDGVARVVLDSRFTGNISERCLEFAAVDRILYNLINNAAKHTADNTIYLTILPLPEASPANARFVVYNRIPPEHQRTLTARYGDNLGGLFQGGFTTGGTGLGMRICADLVANAYGMGTVKRCLEHGYIGATYIDDYFVNWFHWPVAGS